MGKNKKQHRKVLENMAIRAQQTQAMSKGVGSGKPQDTIKMLAWGATPFVITGFGIVMRKILQGLYKQYPGTYYIDHLAINYHGDFCDELQITGGIQNGRHMQWPAAIPQPGGGTNYFGQPKFLELLRQSQTNYDLIFLFEDPFWVGGPIPGTNPPVSFIDAIRSELARKGQGATPIITYFPIDGIPKKSWVDNLAKSDLPITYLNFGALECIKLNPELKNRIAVVNHGVDTSEFFPISKEEIRSFKRSFFGDKYADQYMFLNVNRNQLRKLVPSTLIAFKEFQKQVPNSFIFLNMKMQDVGWNLGEVCQSLGLTVGKDVLFPPNFNVQKGLSQEDLNKLFNAADTLVTTAVGGGWELSLTQAFATKTAVLAPENTSHTELCGPQNDENLRRGLLYRSGADLAQKIIFPHDNEVLRPLPDTDDMVAKMLWMYNNPEACRKMEENAYTWAKQSLSWEKNIVPRFHEAFTKAKAAKLQRIQQAAMRQQVQTNG